MRTPILAVLLLGFVCSFAEAAVAAEYTWWEGEDALEHNFPKDMTFVPAGAEQKEKLSNGAWLSSNKRMQGDKRYAKYNIAVAKQGTYAFWVRKFFHHSPFRWRFDDQEWQALDNRIPLADNVAIRKYLCVNWMQAGEVELTPGEHILHIELLERKEDSPAVGIDCFLLIDGAFTPRGTAKPGDKLGRSEPGWFAWEPDRDPLDGKALLNIRDAFGPQRPADRRIIAKGTDLVYADNGQPARLWGVNVGRQMVEGLDEKAVRYYAGFLAKRGVNLVRVHAPVNDPDKPTELDDEFLTQLHFFVSEMKKAGIYIMLSTYYPSHLKITPQWGIPGYSAEFLNKNPNSGHPSAILFWHPRMQEIYKSWMKPLLTRPNPYTGVPLGKDPAVALFGIVNEDTYFWWGFGPYKLIPAEVMHPLESAFGDWLKRKYGSIEKAAQAWGSQGIAPQGDAFAIGRVGLYQAGYFDDFDWAVNQRNPKRIRDQLRFLTEQLRGFFIQTNAWLMNDAGYDGVIGGSNWGGLLKRSVTDPLGDYASQACQLMDVHDGCYVANTVRATLPDFRAVHVGDIMHFRSILQNPALSPTRMIIYPGHPHMLSEINWNAPSRFRAEMAPCVAAYGLLQGVSAYAFYANDNLGWINSFDNYFTMASPDALGQFPAASVIFRRGDFQLAPTVFQESLALDDLYDFKGASAEGPIMQDPNVLEKIPEGGLIESKPEKLDPLAHFVGRVERIVGAEATGYRVGRLSELIDRDKGLARSATGEILLNFQDGLLTLMAPRAQGLVGFLNKAGVRKTPDAEFHSGNEYGSLLLVSLDGAPLRTSSKILLQVMSEAKNYGWKTKPGEEKGTEEVVSVGEAPIQVKEITGTVSLLRPDADTLRVTALDANGHERKELHGGAGKISLLSDCLYYLITK